MVLVKNKEAIKDEMFPVQGVAGGGVYFEFLLFWLGPGKGHSSQSPVSCLCGFTPLPTTHQQHNIQDCQIKLPAKYEISFFYNYYLAMSSISARKLITLVNHSGLTVSTSEANGTGASVVLASVETSSSIVTGPVVGAEVQVLVAHLTSPALKTLAGPRLGAGPVDTAGVDLALVTLFSLPALVTSEKKEHC